MARANGDKVCFSAHPSQFDFGLAVRVVIRHADGRISALQEPVFKEVERGMILPETDLLRLDSEEASALMDALWLAGVRPSEVGTAGHLGATQAHLKDMRKLVSKALEVEL